MALQGEAKKLYHREYMRRWIGGAWRGQIGAPRVANYSYRSMCDRQHSAPTVFILTSPHRGVN